MTKQEIFKKLKFDMELRNRTKDTIRDYEMHVRLYHDYFDKPADQMWEEEIRKFLHYLITERGNTPAAVNTYNSALRFLYGEALDIVLNTRKLPRIKDNRKIPEIPTNEEPRFVSYYNRSAPGNP